jgi:hypothetical protein
MSTSVLKPGDRVRVTRRYRLADYRPGDKGEVLDGPRLAGHRPYFAVAMDVDAPGRGAFFLYDEIEPDV